jgi:hypothetical protein
LYKNITMISIEWYTRIISRCLIGIFQIAGNFEIFLSAFKVTFFGISLSKCVIIFCNRYLKLNKKTKLAQIHTDSCHLGFPDRVCWQVPEEL